ncbi:MAG: cyclic-phosphate processing receiver domain-containing protein [Mariniblastus sp.]
MKNDTIAILDDEFDRLEAMVPILAKRYPQLKVVTFDNAPGINAWFEENLESCVLICLDHDLGPNRERDGKVFDPGIGRDVTEFLSTREAVCPIIIHTTNTIARPGMIFILEDAGWSVS